MVENSVAMGKILHDNFTSMNSPYIKEVRSRGLFCAIEFDHNLPCDGNDFAKILMKNGLITKATHTHTVRFAPALVINEDEIHAASEIISNSLKDFDQMIQSKS